MSPTASSRWPATNSLFTRTFCDWSDGAMKYLLSRRVMAAATFEEGDGVLADRYVVAILQRLFVDALPVDVCAVQAAVVLDDEMLTVPQDLGVVAGDGRVIHLNVVIGQTADGDIVRGEADLL